MEKNNDLIPSIYNYLVSEIRIPLDAMYKIELGRNIFNRLYYDEKYREAFEDNEGSSVRSPYLTLFGARVSIGHPPNDNAVLIYLTSFFSNDVICGEYSPNDDVIMFSNIRRGYKHLTEDFVSIVDDMNHGATAFMCGKQGGGFYHEQKND